MFDSVNADFYKTVVEAENVKTTLNNFLLLENKKAACLSCELQFNIERLNTFPEDTLTELAEHFFTHKYDNNFFIFDKTSGNRFCFTCFFFFL